MGLEGAGPEEVELDAKRKEDVRKKTSGSRQESRVRPISYPSVNG
jgi:hypothetical protein